MVKDEYERKSAGPINLKGILPDITDSSFKKRGFSEGKLITEWDKIVGTQLSQYCCPTRLSFPKGKRNNGTLYIDVYGSLATELQHMQPIIIEKISAFFGYQAVESLKFINKPSKTKTEPNDKKKLSKKTKSANKDELEKLVFDIEDENLKNALCGLGETLKSKNKGDLND